MTNLSDYMEALAHYKEGSDPQDPDTDDDTIPDGIDPYPLYPIEVQRNKIDIIVQIDGNASSVAGEHHLLKYLDLPGIIESSLYLDWNDDGVYITVTGTSNILIRSTDAFRFYFDLNNDGAI